MNTSGVCENDERGTFSHNTIHNDSSDELLTIPLQFQ